MRPANTETIAGVAGSSASATVRTWSSVKIAVTLSTTPSDESARMSSLADCPLVLVTGIFTFTFGPQVAMARPCSAMPAKSSAKTSNDTGRSVIAASTLRAKA